MSVHPSATSLAKSQSAGPSAWTPAKSVGTEPWNRELGRTERSQMLLEDLIDIAVDFDREHHTKHLAVSCRIDSAFDRGHRCEHGAGGLPAEEHVVGHPRSQLQDRVLELEQTVHELAAVLSPSLIRFVQAASLVLPRTRGESQVGELSPDDRWELIQPFFVDAGIGSRLMTADERYPDRERELEEVSNWHAMSTRSGGFKGTRHSHRSSTR